MGTLSLPPTGQHPPASSLQLCPHPHPLHLLAQILWIHLCLYPHILFFLTPALLPPSSFLLHHHRPQLHSRSTTCHRTLKEIHASHTISEFCNGMPAVFPPAAVLNWSPFFLATTMTSICSRKPILRQPKSSKSLINVPSALTGLSVDKALFPPVLLTLVVVSSLSSTLTWLSLLFLSSLCLPRTPTQTTSVLKSFSPTTLLFNFLTSTPLPSETVLLNLAPGPSILTSFLTPLTLSSSETSMLTTHRGTDSIPLTRSEMTCFAGSLPSVWKFWTTPPLPRSTGSRSSPDILLAPASLASHCEWRTLHGLGSDHLPIEIVLPLFPVRQPNTLPPKFNYKKTSWDIYQSCIAEHLPSLDFDALNIHQAAHSSSLFLVEAANASIPFGRLGRSPQSLVSQEAESAVRERRRARSVAHWSESHRLRYIDASRRASSVISRAKSATWQATCSNLTPRSDPRAVFRLLNAISGKKKHLPRLFFSRLHLPSWHCQPLCLLSSLTSISSDTPFLAQSWTTVH